MTLLIAIEGIDGSGKGTQAAKLNAHLNAIGHKSSLLSFPRYRQTCFGQKIGDFLNGSFGSLDAVHPLLVSLLFAGDRFESKELVEQTLAEHDVVVCDRYVASNVAHQGAKVDGAERTQLIEWIQHLEFSIYRLTPARLTLFLDVPVDHAQRLIAAKSKRDYTDKSADLQEADGHYLARVRDVYLELARGTGWETIPCVHGSSVRSVDEIAADVASVVVPFIGKQPKP